MADVEDVQPDAASKEGEALPEEKPPEGGEPQPQPLSPELEEKIKQVVAEATATATEAARREIQSLKDKARAEVETAQARAALAEGTLAGVEAETDPQALELAKLRAKDKVYAQRDVLSVRRQQAETFDKNFRENMNQFVTSMGVDPANKGIDWGENSKDYLEKQRRILASVTKIQKENQDKDRKVLEDNLTQQQKDFETKIRKDLGLDSEETSVSAGASGTDADFLDKFGKGELPYTKENKERAQKLLKE